MSDRLEGLLSEGFSSQSETRSLVQEVQQLLEQAEDIGGGTYGWRKTRVAE